MLEVHFNATPNAQFDLGGVQSVLDKFDIQQNYENLVKSLLEELASELP